MKKVMLIGSLMVLSGLPNIYASEPMESEDMSMESRDFPTITSVQRVIEGNNQETQKISFKTDIDNMLLDEIAKYPSINQRTLEELNKIKELLAAQKEEKDWLRLDKNLFCDYLKEIQDGQFYISLLKPASGEYYKISTNIMGHINKSHEKLWEDKIAEISRKNDEIKGLQQDLERQKSNFDERIKELEAAEKNLNEQLEKKDKEIEALKELTQQQSDLLRKYRIAEKKKRQEDLPSLKDDADLPKLLRQMYTLIEDKYLQVEEQKQPQEEEKPQKEDQ